MAANTAADKASMAGIGEKLKNAREKRGLAIDQAQKQTHIHSTVLTALEEGRCDEILTPTYVKSFLKKYSNYLGLDTRRILDEYEAIHPQPAHPSAPRRPEEERTAKIVQYAYLIKPLLILIVVTFFIFLLGNLTANYLKASKARPAQKGAAGPAGLSAKKEPAGASRGNLVFQDPIPKAAPLNLTIKVKQQVLIQLKKDGVLLYKRVLAKGSTETLLANDTINIFVAKAEAIELTLNGRRLKIDAKGQVKDLEITRRGVRIK